MSLIVPSSAIGSVPSGDNVQFAFNAVDAAGTPTAIVGGTYQARNLSTDGTFSTGVTPLGSPSAGYHRISIDTTDQSVWQKGYNYAIELTAGTVGAVDVTGMVVGQLAVDSGSAGKLYDQAVKVHSGIVTAVDGTDTGRKFTGQFTGASQTPDFYKSQIISFQPKKDRSNSANQGVGRTILSCTGAGAETVDFVLQDDLLAPVIVGDEFKILPEERELTVYTANITAEWGGLDATPKDQYSIWWSANGATLQNPAPIISQMQFQVWRRVYPGDDTPVINELLTPDVNSGVYCWNETNPANFISQNDGAFMLATASIDDIPVSFGRVLYNYV